MATGKILGVDFGTTNSCAAYFNAGRVTVIETLQSSRTMPSVVLIRDSGKVEVGDPAVWAAGQAPRYTFTNLKRIIGRRFDDPVVQRHRDLVAYEIVQGADGSACVMGRDGPLSVIEVVAHIFAKMRASAQSYFGHAVSQAVITVPAYFGTMQKASIQEAARKGGLEPVRLLTEPTAAAMAYGLEKGPGRTVAIFDVGGGTFDVSIMKITERSFEVLATDGDAFLGGVDFDTRVVQILASRFETDHGFDAGSAEKDSLFALRMNAERAKIQLSAVTETDVSIPWLATNKRGRNRMGLQTKLTREELEAATADLVARMEEPCRRAMLAAGLTPGQIDDVVLVGGQTQMPIIRQKVADVFGRDPRRDISALESVAIGAAMRAANVGGTIAMSLDEKTPQTFGIEGAGGEMIPILPRGSRMTARHTVKVATHKDDQTHFIARIFQGDFAVARDNRELGGLVLGELPARPKGRVTGEFTLGLSEEGVLRARLREDETGREVSGEVSLATGEPPTDPNFNPDAPDPGGDGADGPDDGAGDGGTPDA